MLDTKLVSMLIVDQFDATIITTPLRIPTHFESETLVVLEVVPVFEDVTDTEFECTAFLVPIERVQIVPNEAV